MRSASTHDHSYVIWTRPLRTAILLRFLTEGGGEALGGRSDSRGLADRLPELSA
jgi:hypothetical protein